MPGSRDPGTENTRPDRPPAAAVSAAWLAAALLAPLSPPAAAQEELAPGEERPDTVREWTGEAELSASVFFGNTDQKVALTRGAVERAGSTAAVEAAARFNYGEAALEGEDPSVIKRSWIARLTGEYRPFRAVSPFARASAESSFEKRIDRRYRAGAGARIDAVARDRSRVGWSLMLLGERTYFDPPPGEPGAVPGAEDLVRWATTLRVRHELEEEAVVFASETTYRPEFDTFDRFTLDSTNSISYALSDAMSLKISFVDEYDSEAEARGATSNNDGQILFGLLSTF